MKLKLMPSIIGAVVFTTAIPLVAQACPNGQGANLTQEQRNQIEQIQRNSIQQVEGILTPDQQQQFQTALTQGQRMHSAVASLNLSPQQQSQLQGIMQSAKTQKQQLFNSN